VDERLEELTVHHGEDLAARETALELRPTIDVLGSDLGAVRELRRLRYYRDLLAAGWRHASGSDEPYTTLRTERLALAIDLPELDAVALWSHRATDGSIALPFVEYLLSQLRLSTALLSAHDGEIRRRAGRPFRQLLRLLAQRRDLDAGHDALPRLGDVFLPADWLGRICAPSGLADQLVLACSPARAPIEPIPPS
jgi:hypothetical protein